MRGAIVRADKTGLGYQTRNLVRMLKPDKVLLIDSTPFNKGYEQHPDWYSGFRVDKVMGFMNRHQINQWLRGLTHVVTAETFYNDHFPALANRLGVRTYLAPNFEFSDYWIKRLPKPTKFFAPSAWMLDEFKKKYPNTVLLPTPVHLGEYKRPRQRNLKRTGARFLHVVGKYAAADRNGTKTLLGALKYTNQDFELVIKSQQPLPFEITDNRVTLDVKNVAEPSDLYYDFDAMILPRRYGGNCNPMIEALASGLPVIMTNISPNDTVLPGEWLVDAKVKEMLQTRINVKVYEASGLHNKIDWLCKLSAEQLQDEKAKAVDLSLQFSADTLRPKYLEEM